MQRQPASIRVPDERAARPWALLTGAAVLVVLVGAVVLRFVARSDLWLDEALTVDIARLPLGSLEPALRHDGAPPLFYALLHGWIRVFGDGDLAVRALPGLLGCAALLFAYPVGARVGGHDAARRRAVAWSAVLVFACSPFAIRYSTEVRMYVLAVLVVLVGHLAVFRAQDRPTLGRLAAVAVVVAALLYTLYWGMFLVAVVATAFAWRALRHSGSERATDLRLLGAIGAGAVLFLPWLPTLDYQASHTGTPWATANTSPTSIPSTIRQFAGESTVDARILAVVLVLLAVAPLVAARWGRVDRCVASAARAEATVGAATLLLGLAVSALTDTGYLARYAAVVFPFFGLTVACGLGTLTSARLRCAAGAAVVVLGLVGGVRSATTQRTQAREVADAIDAGARRGDVVAFCPDQLAPDVARLASSSAGLRLATFPDFGAPERIDWVDYAARNAAADPDAFARRLDARAGRSTVWLVWAPGYATFANKCEQVVASVRRIRGSDAAVVTADDGTAEHMNLNRSPAPGGR